MNKEIDDYNDIGVIIPVREGSSRIHDKVLLPFGGVTMLEWKIIQLKQVIPAQNIYVSTDSANLKSIAREYGVSIHNRDTYLCDGHKATFSEVIVGVVNGIPTKHIAWVTVVVPLMSPNDYSEGFNKYIDLVENGRNDSLVSVNLMKEYLWNDIEAMNYQADKNHTISQHLPNIYRVTNGLYMRDRKTTIEEGYFLGPNPVRHIVPKIAGVDIDEIEDYHISEALLGTYYENIIKSNLEKIKSASI